MQNTLKTWGLVLGTMALTVGGSSVLAQTPARLLAVDVAPANQGTPTFETTSYTYTDLFSIAFPTGWQVSEQADAPQVIAAGPASDSLPAMRTEVIWQDAPPKEVVGESLAAIQAKGYTVIRYDAANIDGVTAIRLWLSEIPEDLPNAFVTYVGYEGATATITSYYGDTTADIDPVLNAIHQSFQRSQPADSSQPAP